MTHTPWGWDKLEPPPGWHQYSPRSRSTPHAVLHTVSEWRPIQQTQKCAGFTAPTDWLRKRAPESACNRAEQPEALVFIGHSGPRCRRQNRSGLLKSRNVVEGLDFACSRDPGRGQWAAGKFGEAPEAGLSRPDNVKENDVTQQRVLPLSLC